MTKKSNYIACATLALLLCSGNSAKADDMDVERTTVSPIAGTALVDTPKVVGDTAIDDQTQKLSKPDSAQPHTIADFIIHPLIALKPRQPEEPAIAGRQAETSTTPAPWQFFGLNTAQGIGSSVSSLAGTVTGWLGNRIQLPGFVDTPVRELTTTTTTTTQRPDVVVRVQHASPTRRPLIQIGNHPNRYENDLIDSEEYPYDEYDEVFDSINSDRDEEFESGNRDHEEDEGEEDFEDDEAPRDEEEDEDDEDEDEHRPVRKNRPHQRRRRPSPGTSSRRGSSSGHRQKKRNQKRRRPQDIHEENDNEVDDVEDDEEHYDENDQELTQSGLRDSTKRSQNQQNFIQRGQQSLINQIRQLTRGQSPAELSASIRKGASNGSSAKRRQQATLVINRNGQTIYLAPELMTMSDAANRNTISSSPTNSKKKRPVVSYPQPPLTVPYRRMGKPTQYITIPWRQLGLSPPAKLVSVTEGIQSQPLILNIPQTSLEAMQGSKQAKKKTILTSEAVPLLAEASLMDVFKPPQIPHNRAPSSVKVTKSTASVTPVLVTSKTKQRVRPGTIVEMSPAMENPSEQLETSTEISSSLNKETEVEQYILVGEDDEDGLGRHTIPILGEPRQFASFAPYYNLFHASQQTVRNNRQLRQMEKKNSPLSVEVTGDVVKENVETTNVDISPKPLIPDPINKLG